MPAVGRVSLRKLVYFREGSHVNTGEIFMSVRLYHPWMMPDVITASMGVEPSVLHPVGGQRRTPNGYWPRNADGSERVSEYEETHWASATMTRPDADVGAAIASTNAWVAERSTFVTDFLRSGGRLDYYLTVSCTDSLATELSPDTLAKCVQFGATISLEVFGIERHI
jgi:hypothetical protein